MCDLRSPDAHGHPRIALRSSLPISARGHLEIGPRERRHVERVARGLQVGDLAATEVPHPLHQGVSDGPTLFLEDHREIALTPQDSATALEYRALLLAGDGDLVALSGSVDEEFEAYCSDVLALGHPEVFVARSDSAEPDAPLARRCLTDDAVRARLARAARAHGQSAVVPYLGTESVWRLAEAVARDAGVPALVAAPPPSLTERVNDKLWFAECVGRTLGHAAAFPTVAARSTEALARRVAEFARTHDRVVVKVPNSAGGLGNLALPGDQVKQRSSRELAEWLVALLAQRGWRQTFPLLVGPWEIEVLVSPSVQVWVPTREEGLPIVEGVFSQHVRPPRGAFIGAGPAELPTSWHERLVNEAGTLACVLQCLGFYGRCSFDAVIVGRDLDTATARWVECNGRWGSVSIALTLANRLTAASATPRSFVVVQRAGLHRRAWRSFGEVLAGIGDHLFRPAGTERGAVILAPGRVVAGTGLDLMVLDRDAPSAASTAEMLVGMLLGDPGGRLDDGTRHPLPVQSR